MNHKTLIRDCVAVLDSYNPVIASVEEHVNNYLKKRPNLEDSEQTFVVEVFSGCIRYANIMRIVTNGFFAKDGKTVLRSEKGLYTVFTYMALFRLDELGMAHFRKFVKSQDINKMHRFLNFFLDEKNLRTWMKDEWSKLYENTFVNTTLMEPILRWLPELTELISQLADRIANKVKPKKPPVLTTEIEPFNLTRVKPRGVPMPEPIPKLKRFVATSPKIFEEPTEFRKIAERKEINRRRAEERLMESSRQQFACANPEKSEKTRSKLQKIMNEENNKLDFDRHKSNPLPDMVNYTVPIKLNTAAILREGKLYNKREEEEIKRLEKLESGARDPSDFLDWQSTMRQRDMEAELAEIERRRLEGKLSHEEAILARQTLIRDNKQKVSAMKEEAKEMMQDYLAQRLEEEKEMRKMVESILEGHENAKESKKRLQTYKQKIVQEVNAESQELMRQALEEAEAEMRRKVELIQQIKALESTPVIRFKKLDTTNTAGHGLLSEMSIAELQERITLLDIANREEEEDKRDEILYAKQAKDQLLMDTLDQISKHRAEQSRALTVKLEDRKRQISRSPVHTPQLTDLQRRLEEKKALRKQQQQQAEIKADRKSTARTQTLINNKKQLEHNRWLELEQTRNRTAKLASQGISGSKSASKLANRMAVVT